MTFTTKFKDATMKKITETIIGPIDSMVNDNITEISSTIGSFIIRNIRNRFARSITFNVGLTRSDAWIEEALYAILYKYNDIKKKSKLELVDAAGYGEDDDSTNLYYRLATGTHSLKYRQFDIALMVQTSGVEINRGKASMRRTYTIVTYNLDPSFVTLFEKDMVANRDAMLRINPNSPTVNVYRDIRHSDFDILWCKMATIPKRRQNTLYLPSETKRKLFDTVNNFLFSKDLYLKMGVPHNLKILLHGGHGYGKDTIARVLASEYNRNIFYVSGGEEGLWIPEAIGNLDDCIKSPIFVISDIDKNPYLINELDENDCPESLKADPEKLSRYKMLFGRMINALDGLASPEGRIIIMSTNHIEKFSPVFTRPGRIDLIMEIKAVEPETFRKFVYDNYHTILPKDIKLKSNKLSIADLHVDVLFMKLTLDEFVKKHVK